MARAAFECAQAWKNVKDKCAKGKLAPSANACLTLVQVPQCQPMRRFAVAIVTVVIAFSVCGLVRAQGNEKSDKMLEVLSKKIDDQNAKIDTLSQQILKLEQQISKMRPGVMIGETPSPSPAPPTAASTTTATEAPKPTQQSGNSHVVAKGETLTSIAKMHKVTVEELQKFNHIENDRKLQIGQTIMIPSPSSSSSPSPSPNG
jgi:LysM repeat protein